MTTITSSNDSGNSGWGLIAGNGRFPFLVLEGARSQGIEMAVIAIKEEADPELGEARADAALGEPGRTFQSHRPAASGRRDASGDGRAGEAQQNFQRDSAGLETGEAAFCAAEEKYRLADRRSGESVWKTKAFNWWIRRYS